MRCWESFRISLQEQWYLSKQVFLREWWSNVPFILLVHSCSPVLSCCTLGMQDGKQSGKSGAVCIHWWASKMSSNALNSWVVPVWPQVWVLLWSAAGFSVQDLVTSEISQPSDLSDVADIYKRVPKLPEAERKDSRQLSHVQVVNKKDPSKLTKQKAPNPNVSMFSAVRSYIKDAYFLQIFSCTSELVNAYIFSIFSTNGIKIV